MSRKTPEVPREISPGFPPGYKALDPETGEEEPVYPLFREVPIEPPGPLPKGYYPKDELTGELALLEQPPSWYIAADRSVCTSHQKAREINESLLEVLG